MVMVERDGARHVRLAFSDDAYRTLQELAALKGKTVAETIRDALALEKMFQDTQREGGRILLERDGSVQELVNR